MFKSLAPGLVSALDTNTVSHWDRQKASLSGLPPEIRFIIVDKVDELDRESGAKGDKAMFAVALLDVEFSTLAQKYIWRKLDLSNSLIEDIGFFLVDVLPRHACHVTEITISQIFPGDDSAVSKDPEHLLHQRLASLVTYPVEAGAAIQGVNHQHVARLRRIMLAEILHLLPNLKSLNFDLVESDVHVLDGTKSPPHLQQREVNDALIMTGSRLLSLRVGYTLERIGATWLGNFLSWFPNISELDLAVFVSPGGTERLYHSLGELSNLRSLSIQYGNFVDEGFADLDWHAPISHLQLAGCCNLSPSSLSTLLRKVSPSLEALHLDDYYFHLTPDNKQAAFKDFQPLALPKLKTLTVDADHDVLEALLGLFSRSSVERLYIFTWAKDFHAFISDHDTTLKIVTFIGNLAQMTRQTYEVEVKSLRDLCLSKGIELEAEDPDDDVYEDGRSASTA
ncbi:hypothetical protein P7C70_g2022, partial [Phenoliferia sp. Uapishka_3]